MNRRNFLKLLGVSAVVPGVAVTSSLAKDDYIITKCKSPMIFEGKNGSYIEGIPCEGSLIGLGSNKVCVYTDNQWYLICHHGLKCPAPCAGEQRIKETNEIFEDALWGPPKNA